MKAGTNQFLPFLNGNKQFIIPIYQRIYSWTEEQCAQLWNDIVRAGRDTEVKMHFIGSIVYIQHGYPLGAEAQQLMVIDGQQRLTTLSLLLIALAEAIKQSETVTNISYENIYVSYLINNFGKGEAHYKLLLTQSDKETLIQLIDDVKHAKETAKSRHLIENYLYFEERIKRDGIDLYTLFVGISKLIIVEILLDKDHDNPQLIFESLNSTGMDLSQADLIRNYVLMGLDNEEQTRLYQKYWYPMEQSFSYTDGVNLFDRFMRDYLTLKQGTIPNIDKVYVSFKVFQRGKIEMPIRDIVADVYLYSTYFVKMALLKEEDRDIKSALRDINTLKVDVAYPFLLELYDDYANARLSKSDFIAILRLIESYVFRRVICGVPTNTMNKLFATISKEIDKEHYLESVQLAFLQKDSYRRFPRDDEFRAAFVVKDVYTFRSRNYLLRKLENHDQKELVNVESCTIEHVMPQNERLLPEWQAELGPDWQEVQARYLHTIGNLTLTGYNSELSDRPFQEKRDMKGGFKESPLRLNYSLAQLEHWNKDEIEKRAETLADRAVQVWAIPPIPAALASKTGKNRPKTPIDTAIGPLEHPLAGFIPAGFKILQMSPGKFFLQREVKGDWVHYGDGNKPWFAISWSNAGKWARRNEIGNKIPYGVGGVTVALPASPLTDQDVLTDDTGEEVANGKKSYTLDDYPQIQGNIRELFEQLRKRIMNLDVTVREEFRKLYIAYKLTKNFMDIEPQKKRLVLTLNMPFEDINDPKGLCRDVTNIGHFGSGNVEIGIASLEQIDDVMELVRQSFERHLEEDDA